MSTHRFIAKSAGTIGLFTAVSRILGFVRDLIIAAAFGTGIGAEAFVVSFKLPNLLRDLVGEGAVNSAFVPVLTECKEKRREEFWTLASTLFFLSAGILLCLAILGVIFAPQIVKAIAPGFMDSGDPDKFPLTVQLTRVIFPYIFFIGLSAWAMGVLNSLHEFKSSAFGPILLNLSMIVCGAFLEKQFGPMALVMGVLAGGVLQFACQIPPLFKSGFHFARPRWNATGVAKIGKLLIPRALGSAIYQINVFVDSILASFESIVGPGGQSALYYSNRLFQLPLAIFGISLAQAVLPTFSSQMVKGDVEGFKRTFSISLRTLSMIVMPASVGLVVLSRPIVRIVFEHGRFDAYSTGITSSALFFYGLGLLSCSFVKIFVNAFYAMQDTRTPVRTMGVAVALNIVFCFLLMKPLGIGGLTLASSLSATVNVWLLYRALSRRIGHLDESAILKSLVKIAAASVVMGFFAWGFDGWVLSHAAASGAPRAVQALLLAGGITAAVLVYCVLAIAFRVEEAKKFYEKIFHSGLPTGTDRGAS